MTSLLSTHKSESISPLLLAHPKPCVPMALSLPVLSSTTLALRSPITIRSLHHVGVWFVFLLLLVLGIRPFLLLLLLPLARSMQLWSTLQI